MKDLSGKTAVITGGASGIGRAMGELFLSRGMNVVLADIEQGALNASVSAIAVWGGNSRHFFACLDGYQ
jgi:NAD(P)-dependent dehydrogenase (short-subunit alcohol dehydrogenase family)